MNPLVPETPEELARLKEEAVQNIMKNTGFSRKVAEAEYESWGY